MADCDQQLRTSLYVGDLHPDVTENDLIVTFSRAGPLLSVRLCRDKFSPTYNSLCYGYVNFLLPCHALVALKCLNHIPLRGKPIRIMWYERDPIARKNNNGNLFVKNLDQSITGVRLQEIFSKYGTILSCKVAEENGISKGFGFVQFASENSAVAARSFLCDAFLEGKKLYVSKLIRKNEMNGVEEDFRSLFVKYFDKDITADALKAKFSEYGNVSNAVIVKDENGEPKGFGFVNFDSQEAAKRAMHFLNGQPLASKNIVVARAWKKSQLRKNFRQLPTYGYGVGCNELLASNMSVNRRATYMAAANHRPLPFYASNEMNGVEEDFRSLFVKYFDKDITADALKAKFSEYGNVSNAVIVKDENGEPKGFGFVNFDSQEAAKRAMHFLNGQPLGSKNIVVARAWKKSHLRKNLRQMPTSGYGVGCNELMASNMPVNRRAPYMTAANHNPLPFYTSNCQQPQLNSPYFASSIPSGQPIPFHPNVYQHFAGPSNSSCPIMAQRIHGNVNAVPIGATRKPSSQVKLSEIHMPENTKW